MPTQYLRELFDREGTDKGEYSKTYEMLLYPQREDVSNFLEIGIGTLLPGKSSMIGHVDENYRPGASLRAWREFFPNSHIFGVDIQSDTQANDLRISTFLCDSTSSESVNKFIDHTGVQAFQVIVDDGSHWGEDQLHSLENFWPHLEPGGFYFIEDIAPGTLLFENPSLIKQVVGKANYFSVIDWSKAEDATKKKRNIFQKLFWRLSGYREIMSPKRDEWTLIVIRK